jgi:hypothetical protein
MGGRAAGTALGGHGPCPRSHTGIIVIPDSVAMGPARVVSRSSARIPPGGHGPCPRWSHVTVSADPTRWPWALPRVVTRDEGEWVSMRLAGALPLQRGRRGLQSAGRQPTLPF